MKFKARVKRGLVNVSILNTHDQELEDLELRELNREYDKLFEDGEAASDFERGN